MFEEYAAGLGFDLCFQGFEAELAGLPGLYAPPAGALLLAVDTTGEPVGCVALRPLAEPAHTCEMKRLYLRPAARGSGAGRALADAIVAAGRAAGYRHIRLDTIDGLMDPAIGLYRVLGFVEIDPYTANPIGGARYFELTL